jgi:hypothetical protein
MIPVTGRGDRDILPFPFSAPHGTVTQQINSLM